MCAVRAAVLSSLVSVMVPYAAFAQSTPAQTKAPTVVQPSSSSQTVIKEVKFDGGTLDKYKGHLETLFDNPNIVLDGDVGKTTLPRAYLRVSLSQALDWVSGTADARNRYVTLQKTNGVNTFTTMQPQGVRAASTEAELIKTYALLNPDGSWTQPTGPALKEALSGLQKREPSTRGVDFDEKTRLLMVSGTRGDIQMADQVIEELTRARRAAASITAMQTEVNRLNARIESLEAKITELTKRK